MSPSVRFRLQAMMFLQFFAWGSWYVTVGNYMASHGMEDAIFWAYTVGPVSALVAPFSLGLVADRYFAAERLVTVLTILGAVPLFLASQVGEGQGVWFVSLLLGHAICFFPTVGLTATLTFHHLTDRRRQFTGIRVFGTAGWMSAGILVSRVLGADTTALPLQIASAGSALFGLYALTLPHTPPRGATGKTGLRHILGWDALRQLSGRPFLIFLLSIFLLSIPLSSYYAYAPVFLHAAGLRSPAFYMSLGQVTEIAVMLSMPYFLTRLSVKSLYTVGMTAWLVRFILFVTGAQQGNVPLILTGIFLHGLCFNFTFISGQVYVDQHATPEIRGQAQGLLVMVNNGFGLVTGALVSGTLFNGIVAGNLAAMERWQAFWMVPGAVVILVFVVFQLFFRPEDS